MANKFAKAFSSKKASPKAEMNSELGNVPPNIKNEGSSKKVSTARKDKKHIGGYYPHEVSKQLRAIGIDEDKTVEALLAEALDLLFQSRQKPTIAQRNA